MSALNMVDTAVQAKAYLAAEHENHLLVPNRNFGRRKYIHVAMNRQFSLGKNKNNAAPASGKQWVHPAEALLRGHIVYNVKFLGHVEVDNPKGTQVVKDAIRKMKFNKQIKKAEGQKPPKVELTISVDGVTVQEPKFKVIQHQYPLHRISYCADDKSDKRMFTFIAKDGESNVHRCFVLDSEKCAEEITLTIGQAFDLAYRRFLETSGKDMDAKKQSLLMQKKIITGQTTDVEKKVHQLTQENLHLKARVADLERLIDPQMLEEFDRQRQNGRMPGHEVDKPTTSDSDIYATPIRSHKKQPILTGTSDGDSGAVVGRKLENLVFDDDFGTSTTLTLQTNGTSSSPPRQQEAIPALAPPPPVPPRHGDRQVQSPQQSLLDTTTTTPQQQQDLDLFGATPFTPPQGAPPAGKANAPDPFGMGSFEPSPQELDRQIAKVDKELLDLQAGFSQGLSFGTDDFSLEDLDPLNKK